MPWHLAAARAFIGGGDPATQFAQTIQRAIQLHNCSDGLQATLAGAQPACMHPCVQHLGMGPPACARQRAIA